MFVGGSVGFHGGGRFYISLGPFFKEAGSAYSFAIVAVFDVFADCVIVGAELLDGRVVSPLRRMAAPLGGVGHVGLVEFSN